MNMGTADRMVCVSLAPWAAEWGLEALSGTVVHGLPAGLSPASFMDALSQVKSSESQFLILSKNKGSLSSL